jgi:Mn2+/Fe2+ NRAMP family transporter
MNGNVAADRQVLLAAQQRGRLAQLRAYVQLSGPGWLQSAITLGGGSLASSLFLGVLAGFSMLWVQPLAMLLGIIMLSAIGYVTLATGEKPFQAINRHVNPVLGWSWALASLVASMVWCLPQYALATAVLQQNLLPDWLGSGSALGDLPGKVVIVGTILVLTTLVTWSYDSGSWGIRMYELVLKLVVAAIVVCFVAVVIRLALAEHGLDWGQLLAGFVPDLSLLYQPAPGFAPLLEQVAADVRPFWQQQIVAEQQDVLISAAATAVGINMTFLLPYSLLKRQWTREFQGLLLFDLATGMFIPFTLAISCVVIAAATQFHPGLAPATTAAQARALTASEQQALDRTADAKRIYLEAKDYNPQFPYHLDFQGNLIVPAGELTAAERELALALVPKQSVDLSRALEPLVGRFFGDTLFGLGVLGMTLSTITLLMLISGLVITEMLNLPTSGWAYRLATLAAATGALGPFLWGDYGFYVAVPTSVFNSTLLPIAYITFFILMNQRRLLGAAMPRGGRRLLWNVLMALAAGIATSASLWVIWHNVGWPGIAFAGGLLLLALIVQALHRPAEKDFARQETQMAGPSS